MISNVLCFATLADKNKGTLLTDAINALLVQSIDGNQYYYVAHDYNTNYVDAVSVKDLTNATIIKTFNKIFEDMGQKGHKQRLTITNNQTVVSLKRYLAQKIVSDNLLSRLTIESTPQNGRSKHERITSSAGYAQPTKSGRCSCGTN